jgi:hypothetical protein
MANADNLKGKGFDSRTTEEQREIARQGGIASGAARRKKRTMKSGAKLLMDMPASKAIQQKLKLLGIGEEDATYQMGVLVAMLQQALDGNVKAAQFFREMVGEDPKQDMQKKELKLRQDEFKYRQAQDAKAAEMEESTGSLADAIVEAYNERLEGGEDVDE